MTLPSQTWAVVDNNATVHKHHEEILDCLATQRFSPRGCASVLLDLPEHQNTDNRDIP